MAYDMAEEPDSFAAGGLPSAPNYTGATSPIIRPKIASADDTLKETAVAAPTTLKEPAVTATTRKEPAIAATTTRHQQLLGALPQRPSTARRKSRSSAWSSRVFLKTLLRRLAIQLKSSLLPFSALTRCVRRSSGSHPNQPQQTQSTTSTTSTDPSSTRRSTTISTTSTPVGQVKKARKRGAKKGASSSQPAPKRIQADDMVPPTPDGLPRCHEAGKPILSKDMEHLASGLMLPLQHTIHYLEGTLLKEKDPNYPVFSVKVPQDPNFVHEYPADIFFIVDKYCTLIILCPKWSLAQYFDSSNTTTKKDYRRIRGVLDEAILGYSKNGGTFDKKGEFVRPDTKKLGFKHVIDFPCIKQLAGSIKEAFYVLHHLKGFVEDVEMMSLPPSKRDPIKISGEINDDDLREDFHCLQMTYYVVFEGRVPGVYEEWEDCKKQVHKFSGNCYKGYPTRHEAVAKWRNYQSNKSKMKMKIFLVLSLLLTIVAAVLYFIVV
ncbi:hypothetical protein QYE76_022470 [Lolium multiflorum]|uniref:Ribonuclease H1 N-terminal domain-containing protein n=1 Tax=Lolium multiflorum TaxID=4521 RepID=A0AAD8VU50_LOLMU|nr:hypothetical protein QYE76_022470 [Lolium multiflorum]